MLSHVNVLYRSEDELARRVASEAVEGVDGGEAVLVCLAERNWERIRPQLGASAGRVAYLPAGERYSRPVQAMSALADFLHRSLDTGARGVRSIGEIPYSGSAADGGWIRYEAAVNDVFADLPLRAVCLTEGTLPALAIDQLERVHPAWDDGTGERRSARFDPEHVCRGLPAEVTPPGRAPDLDLTDATGSAIRRQLREVVADAVPARRTEDLLVVASELATNAKRHAGSTGRLRLWLGPGEVVLAVSDPGPGIADPYYGFRPARFGGGGRGLWLVNHLSDAVASCTWDGSHTVAARFELAAADDQRAEG